MDITKLSDAELLALAGKNPTQAAPPDLSKYSDDELFALAKQSDLAKRPNVAAASIGATDTASQRATAAEAEKARVAKARSDFEQLPAILKPVQATADIANRLTGGLSDYPMAAASYLLGLDPDLSSALTRARRLSQAAEDRSGMAGDVAEIVGGLALGGGLSKAGVSASKFIPSNGLITRALASGADGLALGAISGAANADLNNIPNGAFTGALAGGAFGAAAPFAVAAGGKAVDMAIAPFRPKPSIPTIQQLQAQAGQAYKAAEDAGVVFSPDATKALRDNLKAAYAERAFHPKIEPGAATLFDEIDRFAGQPVTLKGLETVRRMAGNAYLPGNKSNNALLSIARDQIDDMALKGQTIMGDAVAGSDALSKARDLYSRSAKATALDEALKRADLRAASTGSGGNADNATRQEVRKVLERGRGFRDDEIAALEKVVRGTEDQNVLRQFGKLSPEGNGIMQMVNLGAGFGSGGMSVPLSIAAAISKRLADRATGKNAEEAMRIMIAGGNREAAFGTPTALQKYLRDNREALARSLLGASIVVNH